MNDMFYQAPIGQLDLHVDRHVSGNNREIDIESTNDHSEGPRDHPRGKTRREVCEVRHVIVGAVRYAVTQLVAELVAWIFGSERRQHPACQQSVIVRETNRLSRRPAVVQHRDVRLPSVLVCSCRFPEPIVVEVDFFEAFGEQVGEPRICIE
ncbi:MULTISPECIES: hypothetical protein [Rhodococcus]|jgi:hypothetical protein|uniref:hypothetical protein n=1 Tax=Rhodococcus TaxID=1827 RepID=UPI0012D354C3|nr:hypothetical protein [Rhodococcus erythropolis]UKO86524.1 hypothetical protein ITJ47_31300 [Rhodococcus erythropolis]